MNFISIILVTVGALGVVLAQRSYRLKHGLSSDSSGMSSFGYMFVIVALVGWWICIKAFGWYGLLPIVFSMIFARLISSSGSK